ncbi:MAG: HAD-IIB family hydrolase [Clostridiales bacterium]|nr:HAD-IIB family hydrolase [Clostridiales bacterium]
MKTLYISDLDGTLLNENVEISEFTRKTVNSLCEKGLCFSIATARTAATVGRLLSGMKTGAPAVLMNGACIYDLEKGEYVKTEPISGAALSGLLSAVDSAHLSGFVYTVDDGKLHTYYTDMTNAAAKSFMTERIMKFGKVFTQLDSFSECAEKNVVYYSVVDLKERLLPVYEKLKCVDSLHVEFYPDIYEKNFWFLEAASVRASKFNAVNFLRESCGFDFIVGFGDNLNDLPLFSACDECCAVANAHEQVKSAATRIIGANGEDAVAKYLLEVF